MRPRDSWSRERVAHESGHPEALRLYFRIVDAGFQMGTPRFDFNTDQS